MRIMDHPSAYSPYALPIAGPSGDGGIPAQHGQPNQNSGEVEEAEDGGFSFFGQDGLTFFDLVDAVNPLHHLPVVGFAYRAITDDDLAPAPRVAGGALYGGPIGAAVSAAQVALEAMTGDDLGGHVMTAAREWGLFGDEDADPETEIVDASESEIAQAESGEHFVLGPDAAPENPEAWASAAIHDLNAAGRGAGFEGEDDVAELASFATAAGGDPEVLPPDAWAVNAINQLHAAGRAANMDVAAREPQQPASGAIGTAAFTAESAKPAEAAALFAAPPTHHAELADWAAGAIQDFERAGREADLARGATPDKVADAAPAPNGGWFSDVMLSAMLSAQEQQDMAVLTTAQLPPSMLVVND